MPHSERNTPPVGLAAKLAAKGLTNAPRHCPADQPSAFTLRNQVPLVLSGDLGPWWLEADASTPSGLQLACDIELSLYLAGTRTETPRCKARTAVVRALADLVANLNGPRLALVKRHVGEANGSAAREHLWLYAKGELAKLSDYPAGLAS